MKRALERWRRSALKRKERIRRILAKRRGKTIVHFLHIGKTGGSAVKFVLQTYRSTPSHEIFLYGHGASMMSLQKGDKVIFFLRDPIARYVSAFYGRKREDRPRYFSPWSDEERKAFSRFETPNALALALGSSDREEYEAAVAAMRGIAHIKNSYWDWFCNENHMLSRQEDIYFFGFQESLSKDFERLKSLLDLPDGAMLPTDTIHAHRNPDGVDKRLDPHAIENLKQWYHRDYEFIEFCKKNFLRNSI